MKQEELREWVTKAMADPFVIESVANTIMESLPGDPRKPVEDAVIWARFRNDYGNEWFPAICDGEGHAVCSTGEAFKLDTLEWQYAEIEVPQ